jgi:cyclopropane fatty-acyl-phospholipid synthase-like methyltransferase
MSILNDQGDIFISTAEGFGGDISSQRIDELDKACLQEVLNRAGQEVVVVDLGAGRGSQSMRLAALGAKVTAIDIYDIGEYAQQVSSLLPQGEFHFIHKDINEVSDEDIPSKISIIYSQRTLHYLRFAEAQRVLSFLRSRMTEGGKLFFSIASVKSELQQGYEEERKTVTERFGYLSPRNQRKHQITKPLCLYSHEEVQTLIRVSGFETLSVKASDFGTFKACAQVF